MRLVPRHDLYPAAPHLRASSGVNAGRPLELRETPAKGPDTGPAPTPRRRLAALLGRGERRRGPTCPGCTGMRPHDVDPAELSTVVDPNTLTPLCFGCARFVIDELFHARGISLD